MTNARNANVRFLLLVFTAVLMYGCKTIYLAHFEPDMNSISEPVYLGAPRTGKQEWLTDAEHSAVLDLLDGVEIYIENPRGATHVNPNLGEYWLSLHSTDHKQHFFFKYDGTLLHSNLPKEKSDELARIIISITQRMTSSEQPSREN